MLRGETRKNFWFSSLGQQVNFGVFLNFCRTFGETILVHSDVSKKTLTKSHDYSRIFSQEMGRLKIGKKPNGVSESAQKRRFPLMTQSLFRQRSQGTENVSRTDHLTKKLI